MAGNLRILGKRDAVPAGFTALDVTSHNKEMARYFSPFYLGPVATYAGMHSLNMENAWQFAKLYSQHADEHGNPTAAYTQWRNQGWSDRYAHRRPMGRTRPLCSLWVDDKGNGVRMGYTEARKKIYAPLYEEAVTRSGGVTMLRARLEHEDLALIDFDGYDHVAKGMSYADVLNHDRLIMGHAFVLAALVEGTPMSAQPLTQPA